MNNEVVFDLEGVMDRLENDTELFHEIVQIFFDGLSDSLTPIRAAIEANDPTTMGAAAHTIKGALGNIGAMRAHKNAFELEKLGKSGAIGNGAVLLASLEREIEAFRAAYANYKAKP